jgi:HTH-type transcriptional repressor of NAD biosynthesis genes
MPLHKGHMALIRFAAAQCDELIVSMTHKPSDPIPGRLRFEWINAEFRHSSNIRAEMSLDDFDDETLSLQDRMPLWTAFIARRFPFINLIISSEEYGSMLAASLNVDHIIFDKDRIQFPVSASAIRVNPFKFWDYIADPAKGFFVKRICFYGPESTGKSVMAQRMATHYQTSMVPEVAREMILTNDFNFDDILRIGNAQTQRVIDKTKTANKILFCDTDLITTQVYCRQYLQVVPPVLLELERKVTYDRYFLFDIDVEWVADGMRDLGDRRLEMFNVFRYELEKRKISYDIVKGTYVEREAYIIDKVRQYFALSPAV